jgi:hypothetical protein
VTPESIHRGMLDTFPELGPLFGLNVVLGNFGLFAWEQYQAGNHDLVRRSFDYVEWLFETGDPALATLAVKQMFKNVDYGADVGEWVGPRTRAELSRTDWTPQALR